MCGPHRASRRCSGCSEIQNFTLIHIPFRIWVREKPRAQLSDEADAWFWFPLTEALSGEFDGEYEYPGNEASWKLPCWNYQDYVIWGLTHKMLSHFLESLKTRTQ